MEPEAKGVMQVGPGVVVLEKAAAEVAQETEELVGQEMGVEEAAALKGREVQEAVVQEAAALVTVKLEVERKEEAVKVEEEEEHGVGLRETRAGVRG